MESGQPIGKYQVRERLAKGGMAEVYVALLRGAAGFEKRVALKRILPGLENISDFREMFAREARLVARLSHANVVQVYDFDEVPGQGFYIAMELVEGCDLAALWRGAANRGERLPATLSARIALEVAAALAHAHALDDGEGHGLGLVHRDISPQNVLLSRDGAVKLTDFGIAKAFDAASREATRSGVLKGKFAYMSPEQASGAPLDGRSDLFSLGAVLWELLCGERLFREADDLATLEAVRRKPVPPPSSLNPAVSPELDAVVLRLLARDADERFQRAADLVVALEPLTGAHAGARGREAIGRLVRGAPTPPGEPALPGEQPFADEPVSAALPAARTRMHEPSGPASTTVPERSRGPGVWLWLALVALGLAAGFVMLDWVDPEEPPLPAPQAGMLAAVSEGLLAPPPGERTPPPPEPRLARVTDRPKPPAGQGAGQTPASGPDTGVTSDPVKHQAAAAPAARAKRPDAPTTPAPAGKPARIAASAPGKDIGAAAKPAAARAPARPAVLSISVVPWGSVWVDGEELRDAPIQGLQLSPGKHHIRAVHPRLGRRERTVTLRPGDNGTVILRFDETQK